MLRSTYFAVAMVPFLMLWVGVTDGAPTLGLLALLAGSSTNSTSLLSTLALAHLQAKLTALSVVADLVAILANSTASG